MTLLLAVRGSMATRSMSGPPFALQLHCTTVWCGAIEHSNSLYETLRTFVRLTRSLVFQDDRTSRDAQGLAVGRRAKVGAMDTGKPGNGARLCRRCALPRRG